MNYANHAAGWQQLCQEAREENNDLLTIASQVLIQVALDPNFERLDHISQDAVGDLLLFLNEKVTEHEKRKKGNAKRGTRTGGADIGN